MQVARRKESGLDGNVSVASGKIASLVAIDENIVVLDRCEISQSAVIDSVDVGPCRISVKDDVVFDRW